MGVKDLVGWITKHHPEVITSFPARWDAPGIRGKRIALDATLLTNRFHMADRLGKFNGKAALLGWHGLLTDMKHSGMQPIAVWDERGVREWKAPEARRRQASRATVLARKLHEDRRAERLSRLRDELEYAVLFLEPVAEIWRKTRLAPARPDWPPRPRSPPIPIALDASDSAAVLHILYVSTFASHVVSLRGLYAECVEEMTRASRGSTEADDADESDAPAKQIEEEDDPIPVAEEDASEEGHAASKTGETDSADASETEYESAEAGEEDDSNVIEDAAITDDGPCGDSRLDATDRLLASIAPSADYVETPRQEALSASEVELYSLMFDSGDAPLSASEIVNLGQQTLEDLALRAQDVRKTYVGSLNVPQEKDHAACRELLRAMGVPIVIAKIPYEAEGLASALALRGVVDFVGSEDSDVVVYGVPLLRNLANASQPLSQIDSAALQAKLGWSAERFRDFCILLGTDASPRIAKVGPSTAFKLMQTYASIEALLQGEPGVADRVAEAEYLALVLNARNLFTDLPPAEPVAAAELTSSELGVKKWLWREHRIWPRRGHDEGDVRLDAEQQSVPLELLEAEIEEILDQELRRARATPPMPFTDAEIEAELRRALPSYIGDT